MSTESRRSDSAMHRPHFQVMMNDLFKLFLCKFIAVFFDDILVYSPPLRKHSRHLEVVFDSLSQGQFYLRRSKCIFAQNSIHYLGHIVSSQGVVPDPVKIQAMVNRPTSGSQSELHELFGLTRFYRKFIKGYVVVISPLTTLLWKDNFQWHRKTQLAFNKLKRLMTEALVLATSDFTILFILETDASCFAIGAVLLQNSHPIKFFSKTLCPPLLTSSTYVWELHAITTMVRKWRHYSLGHPFVILTNHRSLKDLMSQAIQTSKQQIYLVKLLGYDYTIQYKAGSSNIIAAALSQIPTTQLFSLSVPNFILMDQLWQSLLDNTAFQELIANIQQQPKDHPGFSIHHDLIFLNGKI